MPNEIMTADEIDLEWLDQRISDIENGMEAAREIWLNWTDGRNVSRLVNTKDYGLYIAERLGHPLTVAAAIEAMPGASTRAVATVAGVSHMTVSRAREGVTNVTPTVLGRDGTTYPTRPQVGRMPTLDEEAHADAIVAEVVAERWYAPARRALEFMREAEHWLMEVDLEDKDGGHLAKLRLVVSEINEIAARLEKGVR
jgi:hypothetical protein